MKLAYIIPAAALGLTLVLSGPALAVSSMAYVPTLWPAEGAFEGGQPTPQLSSKGETATPVIPGPAEINQR